MNVPTMATLGECLREQIADLDTAPLDKAPPKPLNDEQDKRLSRVERASENCLLTVHCGLHAIGHLLAGVGGHEAGPDSDGMVNGNLLDCDTLTDLGYLIENLAALAQELKCAEVDATLIRGRQDMLGAALRHGSGSRK